MVVSRFLAMTYITTNTNDFRAKMPTTPEYIQALEVERMTIQFFNENFLSVNLSPKLLTNASGGY